MRRTSWSIPASSKLAGNLIRVEGAESRWGYLELGNDVLDGGEKFSVWLKIDKVHGGVVTHNEGCVYTSLAIILCMLYIYIGW